MYMCSSLFRLKLLFKAATMFLVSYSWRLNKPYLLQALVILLGFPCFSYSLSLPHSPSLPPPLPLSLHFSSSLSLSLSIDFTFSPGLSRWMFPAKL